MSFSLRVRHNTAGPVQWNCLISPCWSGGDEAIKQRAARIGARLLLRPAESLFGSEVTPRLERESLAA